MSPDLSDPSHRDLDLLGAAGGEERTRHIVDTLQDAFAPLMTADPTGFRTKFRKMAADPFAFYRGSACLFYSDVHALADPWVDERGARVWIQADLHAENFGTYMNADGRLVFDVNDFDEAYLGHWTWHLQRFAASLALLCWRKALPDEVIDVLVDRYARAYLDQVDHYTRAHDDTAWALTLDTASGAVLDALRQARLSTRVDLLESVTVVEDYARRFADGPGVRRLDDAEADTVREAFSRYLTTVPADKRAPDVAYTVLDVIGRSGFGIGSAGLPAYSVLVEGLSQSLDNDVVLTLKQGNIAAPSRVLHDPKLEAAFDHHGHRTALSQRALQAHADRFLGWTELVPPGGAQPVGFVVSEFSPYEADLDWGDVTEPDQMLPLVDQLGRATAKIHCVADADAGTDLVPWQVEDVVAGGVGGDVDGFSRWLQRFAHAYAHRAREDHRLFVDAFRSGALEGVAPT